MKTIATLIILFLSLSAFSQTDPIYFTLTCDSVVIEQPHSFDVYETIPCTIITAFEEIECHCLFKTSYFEAYDTYITGSRFFINAVNREEEVLNINFKSIQSIYLR